MRAQRRTAGSILGLLGILAMAYAGLQTGGSEVQHRAGPPSLVGEIVEDVNRLDDMHW
jgi:hypothetical protein